MKLFLERFRLRLEAKGIKEGFAEDRRKELPFSVRCRGLSRSMMDDEKFEYELKRRKAWCRQRFGNRWDITPIRGSDGQIVGREFMFALDEDAGLFSRRFS